MRKASISALIVVCVFFASNWLFSQDTLNLVKDVPLVSLEFTVADAKGRPVTDLFQYDFDVFDNGQPGKIKNFSRITTPYNAVLLLDCSDSTEDRKTQLVSALARFIDQLRVGDNIAIAAFGDVVKVVRDWNGVQTKINTAESPACHGTEFYKALEWSEKKLSGISGRRGVVVFTDGRESDVARKEVLVDGLKLRRVVPPEEDREFQKVLKGARESGVPFYFVAVDTDLNPGPDYGGPIPDLQQFRARMEQVSDATAGRVVYPNTTTEAVQLFVRITQDLGISYSLGFNPVKSEDKRPHKIEIRVRGEDSYRVLQSRDTYPAN